VNKQEFSASSWRSNQGYTKMHGQPTIKKKHMFYGIPNNPTDGWQNFERHLCVAVKGGLITTYSLKSMLFIWDIFLEFPFCFYCFYHSVVLYFRIIGLLLFYIFFESKLTFWHRNFTFKF